MLTPLKAPRDDRDDSQERRDLVDLQPPPRHDAPARGLREPPQVDDNVEAEHVEEEEAPPHHEHVDDEAPPPYEHVDDEEIPPDELAMEEEPEEMVPPYVYVDDEEPVLPYEHVDDEEPVLPYEHVDDDDIVEDIDPPEPESDSEPEPPPRPRTRSRGRVQSPPRRPESNRRRQDNSASTRGRSRRASTPPRTDCEDTRDDPDYQPPTMRIPPADLLVRTPIRLPGLVPPRSTPRTPTTPDFGQATSAKSRARLPSHPTDRGPTRTVTYVDRYAEAPAPKQMDVMRLAEALPLFDGSVVGPWMDLETAPRSDFGTGSRSGQPVCSSIATFLEAVDSLKDTFGEDGISDAVVIAAILFRLRAHPATVSEAQRLIAQARHSAPQDLSAANQSRHVLANLKILLMERYMPTNYVDLLCEQLESIKQPEAEPFEHFTNRFLQLANLYLAQNAPHELALQYRATIMTPTQSTLNRCFKKALNSICSLALSQAHDTIAAQTVRDGRPITDHTITYLGAIQLLRVKAIIKETGGCEPPISARTAVGWTPPQPAFMATAGISTMPALRTNPPAASTKSSKHASVPRGRSTQRSPRFPRGRAKSRPSVPASPAAPTRAPEAVPAPPPRSTSAPPATPAPSAAGDRREPPLCYHCNKVGHRFPMCPDVSRIPDSFTHPERPGGPMRTYPGTHAYINRQRERVGAAPAVFAAGSSAARHPVLAAAPLVRESAATLQHSLGSAVPTGKSAVLEISQALAEQLVTCSVALSLAEDSKLGPIPLQFCPPAPLPMCNIPLHTLVPVDTGAAMSCISIACVRKITGDTQSVGQGTAGMATLSQAQDSDLPSLGTVDGRAVQALGYLWLRVSTTAPTVLDRQSLHPSSVTIKFMVLADNVLATPILIGLDWIQAANMLVGRTVLFDNTDGNRYIPRQLQPLVPCFASAPQYRPAFASLARPRPTRSDSTISQPAAVPPESANPVEGEVLWTAVNHQLDHTDNVDAAAVSTSDAESVIAQAEDAAPFNNVTTTTPAVEAMNDSEFREFIMSHPSILPSHLSPHEHEQILRLLVRFKHIFANTVADLATPANFPPIAMEGVDLSRVTRLPQYRPRYSQEQVTAIHQQVMEWLRYGIIELATPDQVVAVHNLLCVRKKDNTFRICLDPRPVNRLTQADNSLLPLTSDVLEKLAGATIFSTLDLCSGYLQVAVEPESRKLLAFQTLMGVYRFTRLPFGVRNACAVFNRLLRTAEYRAGLADCLSGYFDDLNVHSNSFAQHLNHLQRVFLFCEQYQLKISLRKCVFASPRVHVLGHIVDSDGLHVDPDKVAALVNMSVPHNKRTVQSFIGLANYYRAFAPDFSTILIPIFDLLKKGAPVGAGGSLVWTHEAQRAFEAIKYLLANAPCLSLFNASATSPLVMDCDASDYGVGAVLSQYVAASFSPPMPDAVGGDDSTIATASVDPNLRVIAYHSRRLSRAECNYTTTEKELLAIVSAASRWCHYLCGRKVIVYTDHAALQFTLRARDTSGRLARWQLFLCNFDLTIVYRPGGHNANADALSRLLPASDQDPNDVILPVCNDETPVSTARIAPPAFLLTLHGLPSSQLLVNPVWLTATRAATRRALTAPATVTPPPATLSSTVPDPVGSASLVSDSAATTQSHPSSPSPPTSVGGTVPIHPGAGVDLPPLATSAATALDSGATPMDFSDDDVEQESVPSGTSLLPRADPYAKGYEALRALIEDTPIPPGVTPQRLRRLTQLASKFVAGPRVPGATEPPDIFVLEHGSLLRSGNATSQLLLPLPAQRDELLARAHLLGHFGVDATADRLRTELRVYWPTILADITNYIQACATCIQFKHAPTPQHPARSMAIQGGLFHTVSIDLVLGLPASPPEDPRPFIGVCVLTEYLSKYAVAYPIRSKEATEIAALLFKYIATFGAPRVILSDQGREFVNTLVSAMSANLGIDRRVTSPYHPASNGSCERTNGILMQLLKLHANSSPRDWPLYLDYCLLAYRTKRHTATGFTPFELMFGRAHNSLARSYSSDTLPETSGPLALYQRTLEIRQLVEQGMVKARYTLERAQAVQRQHQDAANAAHLVPQALRVGDVVYTRRVNYINKKLVGPTFGGPYKVHSISAPSHVAAGPHFGNYKLQTATGSVLPRAFPLDQLRPMTSLQAAERVWDQAVRRGNRADILYDATKILDHRHSKAERREYLVRWDGFTDDFDSWEPERNISSELIDEYWGRDRSAPAQAQPPRFAMIASWLSNSRVSEHRED